MPCAELDPARSVVVASQPVARVLLGGWRDCHCALRSPMVVILRFAAWRPPLGSRVRAGRLMLAAAMS